MNDTKTKILKVTYPDFELIYPDMKPIAIRCITCGLTSFHLNDVENLYCGYCKKFHDPRQKR